MKIGIFTFHRSINYGAFMQAFSLSRKIAKRFPEAKVEIIDYTSAVMEAVYRPKFNLSLIKHPIIWNLKKEQYKKFKQALNALVLSEKKLCNDVNTKSVLAQYQDDYDIFIVGSDAVWNWIKRGFPNPYLMNFEKPVVKMSYAASAYGMDPRYVGDKEREYFAESLKKFTFIGVRDQYTTDLVMDVCPTAQPIYTCDPTVFLDLQDVYNHLGMTKEQFSKYILKKYKIDSNKKIIGIMGVPAELTKKIKQKLGESYVLVGLYNYCKGADRQLIDLSPLEWAAIFGLFDATVSTYFHGTLLSLRHYTPIINMDFTPFSKKNEGKIHDVMRRMNLLECYFESRDDYENIADKVKEVVKSRQAYSEKIYKNIENLRKSSEAFFEKLGELIK